MSTVRSQVRHSTVWERETASPGGAFTACTPVEKGRDQFGGGRASGGQLCARRRPELNYRTLQNKPGWGRSSYRHERQHLWRKSQPCPPRQQSTRPQPSSRWDGKQPIDQALVPLFPPPSFKRKYENRKETKQKKPSCTKTVLPHKGKVSLHSILGLSEAECSSRAKRGCHRPRAAGGPREGPGSPRPWHREQHLEGAVLLTDHLSRRPRLLPSHVCRQGSRSGRGYGSHNQPDSMVLTRGQGSYIRETHCTGSHRPAQK